MESSFEQKEAEKKTYSIIESISFEFVGELVARGNSHYVRLHPSFIRFYELQPGDQIKLQANALRRLWRN